MIVYYMWHIRMQLERVDVYACMNVCTVRVRLSVCTFETQSTHNFIL